MPVNIVRDAIGLLSKMLDGLDGWSKLDGYR